MARQFKTTVEEIRNGPPRQRQLVAARVVACHRLHDNLGMSLKEIACALNYKNHSSVHAHLLKSV